MTMTGPRNNTKMTAEMKPMIKEGIHFMPLQALQ